LVLATGLLLDACLVFSGLPGHETNTYVFAKILHQNALFYGLFLNILPAFSIFHAYTHEIKSRQMVYFFWLYQAGVLTGILGNLVSMNSNFSFINLNWISAMFIAFSFVIFILESRSFYRIHTVSLKINDDEKSVSRHKKVYNPEKYFVWNYFIIIPLIVFLTIFILNQTISPGSMFFFKIILQPYVTNILQITFNAYIYNYFIIIFLSGIFYLASLPDYFHIQGNEKVYLKNKDILKACKIQWLLQTLLFMVYLYFRLHYYVFRENIVFIEKISELFSPVSFLIAISGFRFIRKRFLLDDHFTGMMNLAFMFLKVYILAQLITCFPVFQYTFMFTDWIVAQRHLLLAGFFLPVFFIFIMNNHGILQKIDVTKYLAIEAPEKNYKNIPNEIKGNSKSVKSYFHTRYWTLVWWLFTLSLMISGWVIGTLEAGLQNKTDLSDYLEYPGWISIIDILRPYRMGRLAFFIVFIILTPMVYIVKRRANKMDVSSPGRN
jgi:hypothetical protein